MIMEKCPICNGQLIGGKCYNCGYCDSCGRVSNNFKNKSDGRENKKDCGSSKNE